jgi:hypothetical protein
MNKNLLKKIKEIKKDDPFLITVTVFNDKGKPGEDMDTFLFVNKFPYAEFAGTKEMINKLIDEAKLKNKK